MSFLTAKNAKDSQSAKKLYKTFPIFAKIFAYFAVNWDDQE